MIVGSGDFKYELIENWGKLPEYFEMDDPVDIAVNSQDRVYVGSRGNHPVLIFDQDGKFISCWGEGHFGDPHGVYIAPDDSVFITDRANNVVEKVAPGGQTKMTLGTRGVFRPMMLRQPFNQPTDLAVSPDMVMVVAPVLPAATLTKIRLPAVKVVQAGVGATIMAFATPASTR